MPESPSRLSAILRKISQQFPYLPRTLGLVWAAAPQLTLAWLAMMLVLGLLPGAEEHIRPELGLAGVKDAITTINDTGRYVLVEFPFMSVPHGVREVFFQMKQRGVTPVLAHPERNEAIQRHIAILYPFVESGCLIQLTAMSLTGEFGRAPLACASRMLELRLAHVIASDAHSASDRRPALSSAVAVAARILGSRQEAENMVIRNPRAIISGQAIPVQDPIKPRGKTRWFYR